MRRLPVKDNDGQFSKGWQFGTFDAIQVGNGLAKARKVKGWQIVSPDGVERFCEGNYQQFVPFANLILSNYGCRPDIS